jgi:hypothetical protein
MYAQKGQDLYVNLFINGTASVNINNKPVTITQQNNYPWQGNLTFNINPTTPGMFNFLVRIPGWAREEAMPGNLYTFADKSDKKVNIKVNGKTVEYAMQNGYAVINRLWKKNDVVEVDLPMEIRKVIANSQVKDDIGKLALQRGPLIYCAEWADNNGKTSNIIMPSASTFTLEYKPDLLNGVMTLKSNVPVINISGDGKAISTTQNAFTAIPYYAWAHRGKGEMTVWFPIKIRDIELLAGE